MTQSFIGPLIRTGWRWRTLIVVPLMILIPVSVLVAWFMPRQYQSTALVLLQETSSLGSGQSSYAYSQEMAAKVKGLEAFIKSDLVLAEVLSRGFADQDRSRPLSDRIEALRREIGVKQLSDNFVQITLNGSERQGLGNKLNTVLAVFFEGLLTPSSSATDAISFLARQRQLEIESIEQRIREVEAKAPGLSEEVVRYSENAGKVAEQRLADRQAQLDAMRSGLRQEMERLVGAGMATPKGTTIEKHLGRLIANRQTALEELTKKGEAGTAAAVELDSILKGLAALAPREAMITASAEELEADRARVAAAASVAHNLASLLKQRLSLHQEIDRARARYAQLSDRLRGPTGSSSMNLLRSPALAQIVDAPTDPTRTQNSRLRLLLIGIAASFAFTLGLVTVAEQLDPKLRSAAHLASSTGLPVLVRLESWPVNVGRDAAESPPTSQHTESRPAPGGFGAGSQSNVKQMRS